ncbi:sodium/glucose cotransporter 5-like isoform X4 [Eriocheir sinensis]|uniref:sodium/glucose cotransporter 5-like isoform X4 n=1 Tax=Eriocheir sinensis TaxID=95602 RepID=UPI0021C9AF68|nr:sodium/glucose cotransporter 5-like isoform X4 [Eriocheir sinensis]
MCSSGQQEDMDGQSKINEEEEKLTMKTRHGLRSATRDKDSDSENTQTAQETRTRVDINISHENTYEVCACSATFSVSPEENMRPFERWLATHSPSITDDTSGQPHVESMCRPNRGTVAGYFLAGRYMWWLPVGASLFASNIGSEHFIGLAGSGAAAGIGVGAFEFNAMGLLQLLGWVFLPVFIASGISTIPEYTKKRFGGTRIQMYLAVLSLILYIFTKISVNMYSGAIFIQQALRVTNLYLSISFLLLMTSLCTIFGGLAAVIYTDTLQFFIMIGGSLYVMVKSFEEVGGYSAFQTKYLAAIPSILVENSTCGLPRVDSWRMLRDANPSQSDMPWPAFLMGQMPASIWYWCADQVMVQRVMAARSLSHAKGGTLMAGFAKILPLFIIIFPGMISRILFPDEVGCVDPEECFKFCGSRVSCSNSAYPKLVLEYLPNGMRGIMLSVMLSALMSDLTSIFNSASTIFTMDIWTQIRPKAKGREQLVIGRCFIVLLVVFSILWIPIIERTQGGQLFIYIQAISAYLAPPIAATYCMAITWKRMNESGAFWGLIAGFVTGIVRMIIDFYYDEPSCNAEDTRPVFLQRFHYMYFATFLFWVTVTVVVVVTLCTQPDEKWRLIRTTFFTRYDSSDRQDDIELLDRAQGELLPSAANDKAAAAAVSTSDPSGTLMLTLMFMAT